MTKYIIAICLAAFVFMIIFSTMNTRQKKKKIIEEETIDTDDTQSEDYDDEYDLCNSIYDFMSKQAQYIKTLE